LSLGGQHAFLLGEVSDHGIPELVRRFPLGEQVYHSLFEEEPSELSEENQQGGSMTFPKARLTKDLDERDRRKEAVAEDNAPVSKRTTVEGSENKDRLKEICCGNRLSSSKNISIVYEDIAKVLTLRYCRREIQKLRR
jgi:hypothetical protein